MSQRDDNHPYMSKSQLDDYLTSLRTAKRNSYTRPQHQQRDSEDRGSTPLVRALREKYGSGNTTAGYVDVGMMKRAESPTKRALPPLPGAKTDSSTGWRVGQQRKVEDIAPPPPRREQRSPERRVEAPLPPREVPRERSSSPPKRGDFWSTGVVPNIIVPTYGSSAVKQRPLPRDPREDLYLPRVEDLSISEPEPSSVTSSNVPSINAPSISVPSINAPSINVPSINVPSSPEDPPKPERYGTNVYARTKSSPVLLCAVCNKSIAGRIVTAIGHRFHPECFRCATCSTELEHVAFYENDGKVYCHLDYHELFSPRCKHCNTPIENEVISALGNKYHPGHFFCAGCGDPFGATTSFIVRDKYPWCETCYENKYAPKCAKCRKPVLDEVLNAMGKAWHPSGCFVCKECGRDFGDDGFFIDSADQKPMCKSCKHVRLVRQVEKIKA